MLGEGTAGAGMGRFAGQETHLLWPLQQGSPEEAVPFSTTEQSVHNCPVRWQFAVQVFPKAEAVPCCRAGVVASGCKPCWELLCSVRLSQSPQRSSALTPEDTHGLSAHTPPTPSCRAAIHQQASAASC